MEAFDKVSDVDLDKYTEHTRVVKSGQTVLQTEAALARAAEDFGATAYAIVGFSGGNGWTGEAVLYRDNREKSYEYATVAEAQAAEKEQADKQAAYEKEHAERHPEQQNDPTAIGSDHAGKDGDNTDGSTGTGTDTGTGTQTTGAGNEVSPSTGATQPADDTTATANQTNDANSTPGAAGNLSGDSTTGQQGTTTTANQDVAENKSGTASDASESDSDSDESKQ